MKYVGCVSSLIPGNDTVERREVIGGASYKKVSVLT